MLLGKAGHSLDTTYEQPTPEEREKFRVDDYNKCTGTLHEKDGYNCPVCRNKGDIWRAGQDDRGIWTHFSRTCKCMEIRANIKRMKKSGLKDIIHDYTFEKYKAAEYWQQSIKDAAMEYAKAPDGWFFLGGQSGAGKTHLCTAICREFLLHGKRVQYMLWREDIATLKGLSMEPDRRMEMIERFKNADVLYIDDLFKTGRKPDGTNQRPSSADINTAFEIINHRYNNPELFTIVSSEWSEDELMEIDEATGGRIFERAKAFSIAKDRKRNYRTRRARTV